MAVWAVSVAVIGGLAVGAVVAWLVFRSRAERLRLELATALATAEAQASELAAARADLERLRSLHQNEQVERSRFETEARRIPELESEARETRTRAETFAREKAAFEAAAADVPELRAQVADLTDQITRLTAANAELSTQVREQAQAHADKIAVLTEVRGGIEKDLKTITADALRANQGTFLQLANEVFEKHRTGADAELEARQKAVEGLVTPIRETLDIYKQQIDAMELARSQSYGALSAELKTVAETQIAVRTETSKLVNALRAAPKTRGRWGEHTLRNVLELSGLSTYCDFSTEETFARDGSVSRPDVVIRLPGGRSIVVDAKTSLSAYLDAVDAVDDQERDRHLALHASQIRTHVKQLAAKSYWDGLTVTPDFVVMFVPGDNFYAAAAERDPSLFEEAAAQRVIIVTPATLIALAKAVAFGWRQEKVAENAQRVHALGRDLYKRLTTMMAHIERCGDSLGKSVKHFNQFVGSLEQSVMPQARRFNELEVEGTSAELAALEHIEIEPRQLRTDRDFAELVPSTAAPALMAQA